jgi:hypothetical protein
MGRVDEAAADLKTTDAKPDRDLYISLQSYEKGKRWDDMAKALDAAEKLSDSKGKRRCGSCAALCSSA